EYSPWEKSARGLGPESTSIGQSGSIVRGFEERCRRRLSTPYDAEHLGRSSHREDSTPQYVKRLLHFYHPPVTGWDHFKVGRMVRADLHPNLRRGVTNVGRNPDFL